MSAIRSGAVQIPCLLMLVAGWCTWSMNSCHDEAEAADVDEDEDEDEVLGAA